LRRLLLLLAVVMAACTTATSGPVVNTVTSVTAADPFPVVVSAYGRDVQIDTQPRRIVSLSATHTEILFAIGAGEYIVGTDLTSDFPPAAQATAKVDAFNFNAEAVFALEPDLVVLAFDFSGELEALEAGGVNALLLPPAADLEDMFRQFELIGLATGRADRGRQEAQRLRAAIEAIVARYEPPLEPLTFFHEVDETLFSANSATFLGRLYGLFGLVNIADEAPDEFGSGFPQLSAEFILEADPDLIFLGDAAFGVSAATVAARPGWDELSAVAGGAVFTLDADISGRWGPRTDQVVQQMADAVGSLS
jgi:iron complex transport system substrate-binding protein